MSGSCDDLSEKLEAVSPVGVISLHTPGLQVWVNEISAVLESNIESYRSYTSGLYHIIRIF